MRWLLLPLLFLVSGCSIPVQVDNHTDVYLFHGLAWNGIHSETTKIRDDLVKVKLKVAELHHFQYPTIDRPTILIGKSLGADAVLKIAWDLNAKGIGVDLLIVVDPFTCRTVPPNVRRSVCIRSWVFNVKCDVEQIVKAHHLAIGGVPQVRQFILDEIASISDKSRPKVFSKN
jgi:hypothetical protein